MPLTFTDSPITYSLFSRSCPHERRNMRSVWPVGMAWGRWGRQTSSSLTLNGRSDRVNEVTYDYLGNATTIKQTGNITDEIFAEFDYNANGLLTSLRRYEKDDDNTLNEIAESLYEYNSNNAVTSITHNDSNGSQIVKHSYTYDETNNIVEYLNSIDGQTSYDYDFLGQLISADSENLTDESYTYDANGNRVVANGDVYTTGDNNELTSDGNYTYTYDAEGNRISKSNSTDRELYEWDYRNRLTKVTQQTFNAESQTWETVQIVEYTYDYNNVWIRKIVGENKTIFIPENYQTTVQIDNGTVSHHYLWTPNQQDKLLADTTPNGVSWSLTDHLGTIRDILAATETTHLIYDAFGNLTSGTNSLLFGYTGKAFDADTALQNNINRWYDATIGRWLSVDPIGFEGNDTNLYRYVGNKNSDYDPFGLAKQKACTIDVYIADNFEVWNMLEMDGILNRRKPENEDWFDLERGKLVSNPYFPMPTRREWEQLPDGCYFDIATCWSSLFLKHALKKYLIQPCDYRPPMDKKILPILNLSYRLGILLQQIPYKMQNEGCTSYCVTFKCGDMAKELINEAIDQIEGQLDSQKEYIRQIYEQILNHNYMSSIYYGINRKKRLQDLARNIQSVDYVLNQYIAQLKHVLSLCDTTQGKEDFENSPF